MVIYYSTKILLKQIVTESYVFCLLQIDRNRIMDKIIQIAKNVTSFHLFSLLFEAILLFIGYLISES